MATTKKYISWKCNDCQKECIRIREESRCMCGHRYKEHSNTNFRCGSAKCTCKQFFYIIAEGAWIIRCRCKHKHIEHEPNPPYKCVKCKACSAFDSPFVCNCDHGWGRHTQCVITKEITSAMEGLAVDTDFSEIDPRTNIQRGDTSLGPVPVTIMGGMMMPGAIVKKQTSSSSAAAAMVNDVADDDISPPPQAIARPQYVDDDRPLSASGSTKPEADKLRLLKKKIQPPPK